MTAPALLTVTQTCAALDISRRTFYRQESRLKALGLVEANAITARRKFLADSIPVVLLRRRTGGLRRAA